MNFASVVVLAGVAALVVLAVRYLVKHGLGSLCSDEAGCSMGAGGCGGCSGACRPK